MDIIYDLIGVGIGPFNLGLAALCEEINDFKCLFLEKNESFSWHAGMLLENAKLQVPFYADLVTLANPKSPFSYLCFLKDNNRLFRFTIKEDYFPLRKEYNDYCIWVCNQLSSLRFNSEAKCIVFDKATELFKVYVLLQKPDGVIKEVVFFAKHIVIGIGTVPFTPDCVDVSEPFIFHSSKYLQHKERLSGLKDITIIGSGQSSAEIFKDMLIDPNNKNTNLSWLTRSSRFYPMDYSSFALEMASPDYIDYFFNLDDNFKDSLLKEHSHLYKGINKELIDSIYDLLYVASIEASDQSTRFINASSELLKVEKCGHQFVCHFRQIQTGKLFKHITDALILGTGYKYVIPGFIDPIRSLIKLDSFGRYRVNRNYSIDSKNRIFVQNAEIHSHGFNAPDLGLGPYRNAIIVNSILMKPHFSLENNIAFQQFG